MNYPYTFQSIVYIPYRPKLNISPLAHSPSPNPVQVTTPSTCVSVCDFLHALRGDATNHRKTIGKSWENHGKTMGKWWFHKI